MVRASSWSWVTKMKVMPSERCSSLSSTCICCRSLRSRAPSGSSSRRTFGSTTSARARATRCRWPPESWAGLRPRNFPSWTAVQGLPGPLPPLVPGHAAHPQPVGDVVHEGHVREQGVVLKDGVDVPLEGRHRRDVLALEFDASGRRQLEAGDQPQDRGLAGAGRAEHGEEFPVADVQVHAVYRDGVPEDLGELAQADRRNLFGSGRGAGGQCFGHGLRLTPLPDRPRESHAAECDPGHTGLLAKMLLLHRFCV